MTCDTCRPSPCTCEPAVATLSSSGRRPEPIVFRPYAEIASEFRAAHRTELRAIAEWALATGRSVDLDAIAFVVHTHRDRDDGRPVTRPTIDGLIWARLWNARMLQRAEAPDHLMEHVWVYLHFLAETDRLPEGSDPLAALLEPLQCYGGLGPDGRERPEGTDVDFFCQCKIPYDPAVPDGMVQVILGYQSDSPGLLLATGHGHLRSGDLPWSRYAPLVSFSRRIREDCDLDVPVFVDEFRPRLTIPPDKWAPMLHLYSSDFGDRGGTLVVDDAGDSWKIVRDRRRRLGYRWERIGDREALWQSGYMSHQYDREERTRPRPQPFNDYDDYDVDGWTGVADASGPSPWADDGAAG